MAHYLFPASLYQRLIGALLVLALLPLPIAANAEEQDTAAARSPAGSGQISETGAQNPEPAESNPLPDSPGFSQPPSNGPQQPNTQQSQQQPDAARPPGAAQRQEPVGTAAAGVENTAGIAASKPAGVAIAPPKQRRVRLLVIKVGAIIGAGAALGSVIALSKASPSKPPGSH